MMVGKVHRVQHALAHCRRRGRFVEPESAILRGDDRPEILRHGLARTTGTLMQLTEKQARTERRGIEADRGFQRHRRGLRIAGGEAGETEVLPQLGAALLDRRRAFEHRRRLRCVAGQQRALGKVVQRFDMIGMVREDFGERGIGLVVTRGFRGGASTLQLCLEFRVGDGHGDVRASSARTCAASSPRPS